MDLETKLKLLNFNSWYGLYPVDRGRIIKGNCILKIEENLRRNSMADIDLVIKIPEEDYNNIKPFLDGKTIKGGFNLFKALEIIKNGTPLPKGEWLRMSDLSESADDRYQCSRCGNVVHHKCAVDLYTFNSWCGRCGSSNYPE